MKSPTVALKALQAALNELRELDPWMGLQTMETFLVVAMKPGLTMQEIAEATGLAQSSCSRNVALLSKWHRLGKAGADLVVTYEDPTERRRKIVFLNEKGIAKAKKIIGHLYPDLDYKPVTAKDKLKGYL